MKSILYTIIFATSIVLFGSCAADNMEAPYCHITGKMCYQGEAIGVRGSGSNQLTPTIEIEMWESGFGKEAALDINVTQDGSFSTYVYPGDKRLVTKADVGPWMTGDTLRFVVEGNKEINYEVTPYFTISNVNYNFNQADSTLTASFHVNQVVEEAQIKSMGVLVNNTQFVDMIYNKASKTGSGQIGDVSFTLDCKSLTDCHSLYARVFVKSDKSSYECYSTTPYKVW